MASGPLFDAATAVIHLQSRDPILASVIARVGPFNLRPSPARSLFDALLRSIVFQQLNGKVAGAILGRVRGALEARGGSTPEALARTPDEALRAAGLSQNKLRAIRDLGAKCLDGTVPSLRRARRLGDEELMDRLTKVRGIGPWTVHMLLIFFLGRPDVMPTGDFAIRQAFRRLYRKRREPSPEVILKHARCWQPYRSVASWYLWRSLELAE